MKKRSHLFIDRTGEVHNTNQNYKITIIEYFDRTNTTIQFEDGTILYNIHYSNIKAGSIDNPFRKSKYGVGYLGIGKHKSRNKKGGITKAYSQWSSILERSYSEKYQIKKPSYIGCSVDKEWHNFQVFAEWHVQKYNSETMQDWHIDKDILVKGNKIYSPETCCLVPNEINIIFTKKRASKSKLKTGVFKHGNKFGAQIHKEGEHQYLKLYDSEDKAFLVYKTHKEKYIKEVADEWKPLIEPEVYQAMYNWELD